MIYSIDEVITALQKAKAVGLDKVEFDLEQLFVLIKNRKYKEAYEEFKASDYIDDPVILKQIKSER